MPNFTALDMRLPEVATLVSAIVQARDAVERRSWSHPQEPTSEDWWADALRRIAELKAWGAEANPEPSLRRPGNSLRSIVNRKRG
jgi:hypothetical protein